MICCHQLCLGGLCGAKSEHHLTKDDPSYRPGPHQGQNEPGTIDTHCHTAFFITSGLMTLMSVCVPVCRKTGLRRGRSSRDLLRGFLMRKKSGNSQHKAINILCLQLLIDLVCAVNLSLPYHFYLFIFILKHLKSQRCF